MSKYSHLFLTSSGWHFDAVGVSEFTSLKRFTLRAEDDDGFADMDEVRTVLDNNAETLKHLTLGAYLARAHSWDSAFGSPTIQNLTHVELVDTRISDVVLARIAHAHNLVSLTLHGTLDMPAAATAIFSADHVAPSPDAGTRASVTSAPMHVFLPHLEIFRFALVGHDDDQALFGAVVQFLRARPRLRRLDLGSCPWELVRRLLPELTGLRVLRVRIASLTSLTVNALVRGLPREMHTIHLACAVSDRSMVRPVPPFFSPLPRPFLTFGLEISTSMHPRLRASELSACFICTARPYGVRRHPACTAESLCSKRMRGSRMRATSHLPCRASTMSAGTVNTSSSSATTPRIAPVRAGL